MKRSLGEGQVPPWFANAWPRHLGRSIRRSPDNADSETFYTPPEWSLEQLKKGKKYDLVDQFLADPTNTKQIFGMTYIHDAFFDFLERGPAKLKKKWQPEWDQIVPRMGQAIRDTKDGRKAALIAFEDIDKKQFALQLKRWIAGPPRAKPAPRWAR